MPDSANVIRHVASEPEMAHHIWSSWPGGRSHGIHGVTALAECCTFALHCRALFTFALRRPCIPNSTCVRPFTLWLLSLRSLLCLVGWHRAQPMQALGSRCIQNRCRRHRCIALSSTCVPICGAKRANVSVKHRAHTCRCSALWFPSVGISRIQAFQSTSRQCARKQRLTHRCRRRPTAAPELQLQGLPHQSQTNLHRHESHCDGWRNLVSLPCCQPSTSCSTQRRTPCKECGQRNYKRS